MQINEAEILVESQLLSTEIYTNQIRNCTKENIFKSHEKWNSNEISKKGLNRQ